MNNLSKVILGIIAAVVLYFTFHVLVALLSLAVWVAAIAIVVYVYRMFRAKENKSGSSSC